MCGSIHAFISAEMSPLEPIQFLYPGVVVLDDSIIGDNCILHPGVVIGSDGFGFAPNEQGEYQKIPQNW